MGAQAEAVERAVVVLDPAEFMWSDESSPLDAAELEELRTSAMTPKTTCGSVD